ncbi:hypothetical protein LTR56_011116 [Elasticomyces elasticus]|nr:hypothetical protein LTR56_011116 [Elasticomyces elasticus]KAK3662463.1 hypothetical protein LTR22_006742 [Elasticomyces elasticus]KAK4926452.1 hypothetical protein LTR49_006659 [Elasticomyces elasticus]KAK5761174.1 hypothetical protein LTS12_008655 [Elasticomyces elasticus]
MSSSSGLNAHIFLPPLTPSTATSTDYFSSRKRPRPRQPTWTRTETTDVRSTLHQTPGWQLTSQSQYPTPSYNYSINERYTLAGGLDTPGLLAQTEPESLESYNDRRSRRDDDAAAFNSGRDIVTGPLARERNGVARLPHLPASPNGGEGKSSWTGLAFSLVGKVFTFGTSVVKGFYAGGGTGYSLTPSLNLGLKDSPLRGLLLSREVVGTPVPGSWHDDGEFLGDFEQDNTDTTAGGSGQRPGLGNKRRQTGENSWVMVGTPDLDLQETSEIESSPRRKAATSRIARPSASRASSRRSLAPLPRRQSSYTNAGAGAGYSTGSPLPTAQGVTSAHDRRASVAPVRTHSRHGSLSNNNHTSNSRPSSAAGTHNPSYSTSTLHTRPPTSSALNSHHSPRTSVHLANGSNRLSGVVSPGMIYVSPEAEKILRRREKHERKADAAMSDLGRKLGDLIREGREALGTRIDVDGDDGTEEGW